MPICPDQSEQASRHTGTRNRPSHPKPISLRVPRAFLFVRDPEQPYHHPDENPMTTTQFLVTPHARSAHDSLPACADNIAAAHYNAPNRAYHTWQHVLHVHACANTLLAHLLERPGQLSECEAQACSLAISWHDVFQGPNHEAASAAKLYHGNPNSTSALAARLIVDGTTHFATPDTVLFFKSLGIAEPSSENLKLLTDVIHDADLMILGEEATRYDEYARAIVVEALAFGLNLADYRDRRIQFLHRVKSAATAMNLFTTAPAQQLNGAVLENIERELGRLGQP